MRDHMEDFVLIFLFFFMVGLFASTVAAILIL